MMLPVLNFFDRSQLHTFVTDAATHAKRGLVQCRDGASAMSNIERSKVRWQRLEDIAQPRT